MTTNSITAYKCTSCDHIDTDHAGSQYECSSCGTTFNREHSADGDSHRCPDCNKFAGRTGVEYTCIDCGEEAEECFAVECPMCNELFDTEADGHNVAFSSHVEDHTKEKNMPKNDLESLPKWVQDKIAVLELQVSELTAQAKRGFGGPEGSPVQVSRSNANVPLKPHDTVVFRLGNDYNSEIHVHIEDRGDEKVLSVRGMSMLAVLPSAGNVVHITTR